MAASRDPAGPSPAACPQVGTYSSITAVLSGLSVVSASRLVAAGLAMVTQIYLAKTLSPDALGRFFLATSFAATIAIVASCGYPMVVTRFLVRYRHRPRLAAHFLSTARLGSIFVSLLLSAIVIAGLHLRPDLSPDARTAVAIGCLAAPGFVLIRLGAAAAIAYRRFELAFLPDLVGRPLLFLIAIGLIAWHGAEGQLNIILSAFAGLALLHGIWQNHALRRFTGAETRRRNIRRRPAARRLSRSWTAVALPLTGALLLMAAFSDIVVLVAGQFLTAADLAVLGVCVKLSMIVAFVQTAAYKMLQPDLADAMARGDRDRLSKTIRHAIAIACVIALAALGSVVATGDFALSLFGRHFTTGQQVLLALLAGQVIVALGGPAIQILTLGEGQIAVARMSLVAVATLVAFNLILTPVYGIAGAAAAIIATQAIWALVLAVAACRMIGMRCDFFAQFAGRRPKSAMISR